MHRSLALVMTGTACSSASGTGVDSGVDATAETDSAAAADGDATARPGSDASAEDGPDAVVSDDASYAVGVASAASPVGPFAKAPAPIVVTGGAWVGPGHCAIVDTPAGDTAIVYHAWKQGCVDTAGCGRLDLVDQVVWGASWPSVPLAPSSTSRPLW
jgi:hypothetical protein